MADYDASVRVHVKGDNSDLKELEKEFDQIEQRNDKVSQKVKKTKAGNLWDENAQKEAEAQIDAILEKKKKLNEAPETPEIEWERETRGFDWNQQAESMARMNEEIEKMQAELFKTDAEAKEAASSEQQQVNNEIAAKKRLSQAIDEQKEGFQALSESSKKCFKTIQNGTKKSNGLLSTLGSRLKGIVLSLLVFNWITKGFNAMVSAMKAGFQNLAQYSADYNKSMSDLKSQTAQLKNGLAAAFEPIANMVIPYLTQLVSWLNIAVDAMGQFLAALQGKSTYTRAKKQVIDYAKSLDTASKSAKRALASFDELNVLNKNGSVVTAGGELSGADAFEEAEINPEIYTMLEKVKGLLEIIKPLVIAIGIAFLAWKLAQFLKDLGSLSNSLYSAYGIILLIAGIALSVYELFNMWKNGVDWDGTIGYVSGVAMAVSGLYMLFGPFVAGIGLIVAGIAGLVLVFKDMTDNGFAAENMTLALISVVGICAGVFIAFGAAAGVVVSAVAAVLGIFAALIIGAGNGEEALRRLQNMFGNLGTFVKSVFSRDWETALDSIVEYSRDAMNMGNILAESFINCIIKGLNWLIEKLNSISFEAPDWVPFIGGKAWNPSINTLSEVSLPRLADGAVIQGGKPFAAILGDQPVGQTNIETPLATMVEAFKQAMHETGENGGGQYTFVAQLDGRTLFKETVNQDKIYRKASGHSAFAH